MVKLYSLYFAFFLLCFHPLLAGPGKEYLKKQERADALYEGANYAQALAIYLELYSTDTTNLNTCYKIGSCYLKHGKQHHQAVYFLKKAIAGASADYSENRKNERRAPLKALKLLADACHLNNEFDLALHFYKRFRQMSVANDLVDEGDLNELSRKIEICINAKELIANPVDAQVVNMGDVINSAYPDYAPRISANQSKMVFTSRRAGTTGGGTYDGGQYFEDIYISVKKNNEWQSPENIGWPVNTVGNEAVVALSPDGQEMLIYKDDLGNGNIYYSCFDDDRWSTPVKLNANINSSYWESSACISSDGNSIYFTSDRPGGYGGTDIYKSVRMPGGDWGPAVNLGSVVNSSYDEYAPFLHADGMTLFFSSKGHKTMGGFDVFYSTRIDGDKWSVPCNIGFPINSTGDDAFFIMSPDKKSGYYSSYRDEGFGEKDNYMIIFPSRAVSPVALLQGKLLDECDHPVKNPVITVTENTTNLTGLYRPNSRTGEYLVVLPPGNYNISYEGDGLLFYSLNQYVAMGKSYTEKKQDIKLPSATVGARITLNNIFFDFDDAGLRTASKAELDKLYELLKNNRELAVEVSGYADSKGTDEYNRRLSYERALAVRNYLIDKGVEENRIIPVGLGKEVEKPGESVAGLNASERRVELKVIEHQ